jgi:opacity protein-like surface antigen
MEDGSMVINSGLLKQSLLGMLCGLAVLLTSAAFAGDGVSPYLSVYGGMAVPESLHDVQGRGSLSGFKFSDFSLKSGPMAGAKFGIMGRNSDSLARWLGLEIDASWLQSKIKQQNSQVSFVGLTGTLPIDETKIQLITGALHLIAKYPDGPVQPYIGAGPAVVHARNSESATFNSSSTTNVGLSAVGGLRFQISEHIGLFGEYKYIRASLKGDDLETDAAVHAAVGGINFVF